MHEQICASSNSCVFAKSLGNDLRLVRLSNTLMEKKNNTLRESKIKS